MRERSFEDESRVVDQLFADLFSRVLPEGAEPLTPLEVASLRAQAGKLLGKLWFGEYRGLRKRVLESSRLKNTIRAIDSECYGPDGEPKDSVDQDTAPLQTG